MSKRKICLFVIIGLIVIIILGVFLIKFRFDARREQAVQIAREYLFEKYNREMQFLDVNHVGFPFAVWRIKFSSKNNPNIIFNVRIGAGPLFGDLNRNITDDYLERLSEYILKKDLNEYVIKRTDNNGRANIDMFSGRIIAFSMAELENNPSLPFEKLQKRYWCRITLYNDISKNDYVIDYYLIYDIFTRIFEIGLSPYSVSFNFDAGEDGRVNLVLSVSILNRYFPNINSSDDLRAIFEEERRRQS